MNAFTYLRFHEIFMEKKRSLELIRRINVFTKVFGNKIFKEKKNIIGE